MDLGPRLKIKELVRDQPSTSPSQLPEQWDELSYVSAVTPRAILAAICALHDGMYPQTVSHMNPFFIKLLLPQKREKRFVHTGPRNGSKIYYFGCLLRIDKYRGFKSCKV